MLRSVLSAIKPRQIQKLGSASVSDINYLAQAIKNAVLPVFLLGNGASSEAVTYSIRQILKLSNYQLLKLSKCWYRVT